MTRTNVGILRGGTSNEYNLSLKTGAAMLTALPDDAYDTRDIFIDRSGMWHVRGAPAEPARALAQIDVVLNGLHGGVGEDGTVQKILEHIGMPFAGSRAHAARISLDKILARERLARAGIRMPRGISFSLHNQLNTAEMIQIIFSQFGPPYVVKPHASGASDGVHIVKTPAELSRALADVLDMHGAALVEEYVRGQEASVGLLEHFRGKDLYAFPPVHVMLPSGLQFLSLRAHEAALARNVVPSNFSPREKDALIDVARIAHRALGLSHFSRADIILTPRGPYLLEMNALPGLYPGASFPAMLEAVGSSIREFLEHSINLARRAA
jgi:D-alanine-D-alanine ligase